MAYARIMTVDTPPSFTGLVGLATVKDELDVTDSSLDARLARWASEATAAIEATIGRVIREQSITEIYRGQSYSWDAPGEHFYPRDCMIAAPGPAGLISSCYPLTSMSALLEDTIALVRDTDFEIDPSSGLVYRLSGTVRVPWSGQVIAMSYTAGYASADVPLDLQAACLSLIKHRRAAQTRDPYLRQITVPGVIEQQYWSALGSDRADFPPDVMAVIDRYRDVHL